MSRFRIIVLLLLLLAAACASTEEQVWIQPKHQYRVRMLPVEGAAAALEEPLGEDGIPVSVGPAEFEEWLRKGLEESHVFSELVTETPDADLILRVSVKSARIEDLGVNGGFFLSTVSWLFIPFLWLANDRSYAIDFSVQADLFASNEMERPVASFVAAAGEETLDLWDRGPNLLVVVVPPALIQGSEERLSNVLTEKALNQVTQSLVAELTRREIPFRFEIDVESNEGTVRVVVRSRRLLRSLEVRAGGRQLGFWAEDGLVPVESEGLLVYERRLDSLPAEDDVVRVIAEDETGGREVRTVLRAGKP